jgi:uncharacterized membrane protein
MHISQTAKKVIAWRLLSFTLATIICYPFIGSFIKSISLTIVINVIMTIVHYFFEKYWDKRYNKGKRAYT